MNQMPREMEDAIERGYFVNERIYEQKKIGQNKEGKNGGSYFRGTDYICKDDKGEDVIVTIKMTGDRKI